MLFFGILIFRLSSTLVCCSSVSFVGLSVGFHNLELLCIEFDVVGANVFQLCQDRSNVISGISVSFEMVQYAPWFSSVESLLVDVVFCGRL